MSSCEEKAYQGGQPCSALALAIAKSYTKCCKHTNIQKGSHSQLESLISELLSFLTKKNPKLLSSSTQANLTGLLSDLKSF